METLLSAPTSFLDALEKELIDSGMAEATEEGDDAAGACAHSGSATRTLCACLRCRAC
jgi:hypothetical protein